MDHKNHHSGVDNDAGFVQVMNPKAAQAFGAAMRKAREDAGITLERAAILTRISPAFIQALETGDFKKLPGLVFARGFVRNLCKPYHKNPAEMLNLFNLALRSGGDDGRASDESAGGEGEDEATGKGRARTPFNASRLFRVWTGIANRSQTFKSGLAGHKRLWGLGAAGGALALLAAFAVTNMRGEKADAPLAAKPTPKAAAQATSADVGAVIAKTMVQNAERAKADQAQGKAPAPGKDATNAPAPSSQIIKIDAKNQVVVRFSKDGGAFETSTLDVRSHTFEFEREAQLLIFDAAAVDVNFNGRALGPLGSKGRVRRLSFRKDDLAEDKKF